MVWTRIQWHPDCKVVKSLLRRLQAVLNASVRAITGLPRSAHITVARRTALASCGQVHQLQAGDVDLPLSSLHSPRYLSAQLVRVSDILSRRRFRSSATDLSALRGSSLSVIGRFRLRLLNCGTNFPATSPLPSLWQISVVSWKLFFFGVSFPIYILYR